LNFFKRSTRVIHYLRAHGYEVYLLKESFQENLKSIIAKHEKIHIFAQDQDRLEALELFKDSGLQSHIASLNLIDSKSDLLNYIGSQRIAKSKVPALNREFFLDHSIFLAEHDLATAE
jgi:hypothetical protein